MSADTEAMEAARRIIAKLNPKGGHFQFGGIVAATDADMVALALLQQRESIIEECAKVADKWRTTQAFPNPFDNGFDAAAEGIAKAIRALAARKETPNE